MRFLLTLLVLCAGHCTVFCQSILSVTPNTGRRNQLVELDIVCSGTSFFESSKNSAKLKSNINGSEIAAVYVLELGDSSLFATFKIPANAIVGDYSLSIKTANQGTITKGIGFTVTNEPPVGELVDANPKIVNAGQQNDVVVKGVFMKFSKATNIEVVLIGSKGYFLADTNIITNDTQLISGFRLPATAKSGIYSVKLILNDSEEFYLSDIITVNGDNTPEPILLSVNPGVGKQGEKLNLTVYGRYTFFTKYTNLRVEHSGSGVYTHSVVVVNDSVLKIIVDVSPDAKTGFYNINVISDNCYLDLTGAYKILWNGPSAPRLLSVSPDIAKPNDQITLTIKAVNTRFLLTENFGMSLFNNGSGRQILAVFDYVVVNDSTITADVYIDLFAEGGKYTIAMYTTTEDYMELSDGFTIDAPLGMNELPEKRPIMYPNPVSDELFIVLAKEIIRIGIIDLSGKELLIDHNDFEKAAGLYKVNTGNLHLRSGFYLLKLYTPNSVQYSKLMIHH